MKSETQEAIISGAQQALLSEKSEGEVAISKVDQSEDENSLATWLKIRCDQQGKSLRKRDLKQFEKEHRVITKYLEGLKPKQVSRELHMTVDEVNKALATFRRMTKKVID